MLWLVMQWVFAVVALGAAGLMWVKPREGLPVVVKMVLSGLVGWYCVVGVWRGFRVYQRREWARRGLCPGCGYDLRASRGRCPECGREIAGESAYR